MSSQLPESTISVVDTLPVLEALLDYLATIPPNPSPLEPPPLYIDLEGTRLGRSGSISILSLHVLPQGSTYLVDISVLGSAAFTTENRSNLSLKTVLESPAIPKVIFDVRNDSDALFGIFGVALSCVQDLQLMELAAHAAGMSPRTYVVGLARCIERDLPLSAGSKAEWALVKMNGSRLFAPEKGGSYAVFDKRPMHPHIVKYCAQDVSCMPVLWEVYAEKLCKPDEAFWRRKIRDASIDRIKLSQSRDYKSEGENRALGPWDRGLLVRESKEWTNDATTKAANGGNQLKELTFGEFCWE